MERVIKTIDLVSDREIGTARRYERVAEEDVQTRGVHADAVSVSSHTDELQ